MSWPHTPPDEEAISKNAKREPEGERIRRELIEFLERNKIVGILLGTTHHTVEINIDKLPSKLKNVLTKWGAISVVDDSPDELPANQDAYCVTCATTRGTYVDEGRVCCKVCQRFLGLLRLEYAAPERPEGWDDDTVPPMTHPLGKHWSQPDSAEMEISSKTAKMSRETFDALAEYSTSNPTGAYEGKMWKRHHGSVHPAALPKGADGPAWLLCWYGYSRIGTGYVSNNHRKIILTDGELP